MIPPTLQKHIDELAEKSINRNMYELHEADARVRQYKLGAAQMYALMQPLIDNLKKIENECACPTPEKCYDYAVQALTQVLGNDETPSRVGKE